MDSFDDEKIINARFIDVEYPTNDYVAGNIVEKCWRGEYSSAAEISIDIAEIQAAVRVVDGMLKEIDVDAPIGKVDEEIKEEGEEYEEELEEEEGEEYEDEEDGEYEDDEDMEVS